MPSDTAYLIFDTETVPDGELVSLVKYPDEKLAACDAIDRAREEAKETSWNGSDFLPYTFHVPVALCVLRVNRDLSLEAYRCLDAPEYRPREITRQFWRGLEHYGYPTLVTFNGRCFDIPLLELCAFRYGFPLRRHIEASRLRYKFGCDLQEFFTNFGAARFPGGLNVAAKLLGLPGKMSVQGKHVLEMHRAGRFQEINDYCLCDTLDTYFVFLRTRVMTEEITLSEEKTLTEKARACLMEKADEQPVIARYFEEWDRTKTKESS